MEFSKNDIKEISRGVAREEIHLVTEHIVKSAENTKEHVDALFQQIEKRTNDYREDISTLFKELNEVKTKTATIQIKLNDHIQNQKEGSMKNWKIVIIIVSILTGIHTILQIIRF
jgi:predicted  nucleic acid-binding Zn-ribbon protein